MTRATLHVRRWPGLALRAFIVISPLGVSAIPSISLMATESWAQVVDCSPTPKFTEAHVAACMADARSTDPERRAKAIQVLGRFRQQYPETLPVLVKALADPSPMVRYSAAGAFEEKGPHNTSAIESLIRLLDDSTVVEPAKRALIRIGGEVVPYLIKDFDGLSGPRQQTAIYLLGQIGPSAAAACPLLERVLLDPHLETRLSAAIALANISPESDKPVPVLKEAMSSGAPIQRSWAVLSLEKMHGPAAKQIEKSLISKKRAMQWVSWAISFALVVVILRFSIPAFLAGSIGVRLGLAPVIVLCVEGSIGALLMQLFMRAPVRAYTPPGGEQFILALALMSLIFSPIVLASLFAAWAGVVFLSRSAHEASPGQRIFGGIALLALIGVLIWMITAGHVLLPVRM